MKVFQSVYQKIQDNVLKTLVMLIFASPSFSWAQVAGGGNGSGSRTVFSSGGNTFVGWVLDFANPILGVLVIVGGLLVAMGKASIGMVALFLTGAVIILKYDVILNMIKSL